VAPIQAHGNLRDGAIRRAGELKRRGLARAVAVNALNPYALRIWREFPDKFADFFVERFRCDVADP
jgi:hypothetical protein